MNPTHGVWSSRGTDASTDGAEGAFNRRKPGCVAQRWDGSSAAAGAITTARSDPTGALLHAEIRALVDSEWLPAIRQLALALHRVGRLPVEDEPLIADELAAANGWRRNPDDPG